MTMTIDEALNRAEAMSAGLNWILLSQYEVRAEYASPEVSIDLDNRVIGDLSENVSTEGENNAEYISFIMDRYHDGVDLSNMLIQIQYELEDGSGSIDGVVNAYMNDDKIKFGWVVPPAAAQVDAVIKIMVFCTGTLGANTYTLKTLPMEYTIHSTLETGGSIPQPDENWYLQFANTMQHNVLAAKESADAAAQSASDASDDLADIKAIQSDVNSSKSTVQTLAQQVQDNTTKAQESADAAKVSEQNAQEWFEKTKEHSGVVYASEENAGIVSPQEIYVNHENGKMQLTKRTTDRNLSNSYSGGIKINEVVGKSEQKQYAGKNLLNATLATTTTNGVTCTNNGDGTYTLNGTASANAVFAIIDEQTPFPNGTYKMVGCPIGGSESTFYLRGFNYGSSSGGGAKKDIGEGQIVNVVDGMSFLRIYIISGTTVNKLVFKPMITTDLTATYDDFEPYTGGIPSPNPDYPQEIKSVEVGEIKSSDDNGNESTVIFSTPITLRGIGDVKDRIVRKDGMCGIERGIARIESYNGESITTEYISTTGGLDTGATVDYVLSATTFEQLPEADQIALHSLKSFDTVTYISTDSEIEPVIDLEYGTSRVGALSLKNTNDKEVLQIKSSEIAVVAQISDRLYTGVDLTIKFATEIKNYSDEWAWIKARKNAGDYAGIHVGDYIPITCSNGYVLKAQIAGINTYTGYGDTAVGNHIDFVCKELWNDIHVFNKVNYNNGNANSPSPFLASDINYWLNSMSGSVPNSESDPSVTIDVDYTTGGVLYYLPDKLKNQIITKRILLPSRYTAGQVLTNDNLWAWQSTSKLWIPSEVEVYGAPCWGNSGYGVGGFVQYPLFACNMNRVKLRCASKDRYYWWLLSAYAGNSTYFATVNGNGNFSGTNATATWVAAPVCFRI